MQVIAAPGVRVPLEHDARQYITDGEPAEVPESAYYLRRLSDGDLLRHAAPPAKAKPKDAQ